MLLVRVVAVEPRIRLAVDRRVGGERPPRLRLAQRDARHRAGRQPHRRVRAVGLRRIAEVGVRAVARGVGEEAVLHGASDGALVAVGLERLRGPVVLEDEVCGGRTRRVAVPVELLRRAGLAPEAQVVDGAAIADAGASIAFEDPGRVAGDVNRRLALARAEAVPVQVERPGRPLVPEDHVRALRAARLAGLAHLRAELGEPVREAPDGRDAPLVRLLVHPRNGLLAVDEDAPVGGDPESQVGCLRGCLPVARRRVERDERALERHVLLAAVRARVADDAGLEREVRRHARRVVEAAERDGRGEQVRIGGRRVPDKRRGRLLRVARQVVVQREAGRAEPRGDHDLRLRRVVPREDGDLLGRVDRVDERDGREVDRRGQRLRAAAVRASRAHQLRRERPPDLQLAQVDGIDRREELVGRTVARRVGVEARVVGVPHRIGPRRRLVVAADPARVEEAVRPRERGADLGGEGDVRRDVERADGVRRGARAVGDVRAGPRVVERELRETRGSLRRQRADRLEPDRVAARVLEKRVGRRVRPVRVEQAVRDVEVLLLLHAAAGGDDLVVHRLDRQAGGVVDDRLGLRRAALRILGVAHIGLRARRVPRRAVDVHLEGPDDVQLLLRAPEDLDLPRVRARVADRPEVVLLRARAMLVDVDLAVLRLVREAARHAREELVRREVARLGLELVADLHVNLRLLGLQDLDKLVGEHPALVQGLVETRVDDEERAVAAREGLKLVAVQADVAAAVVRIIGVLPGLRVIDADPRRRIEMHLVVLPERDRGARVLEGRVRGVARVGRTLVRPVEAHGPLVRRRRDDGRLELRPAARERPGDAHGARLAGDDLLREVDPDGIAARPLLDLRLRPVPVRGRRQGLAEEPVRARARDGLAERRAQDGRRKDAPKADLERLQRRIGRLVVLAEAQVADRPVRREVVAAAGAELHGDLLRPVRPRRAVHRVTVVCPQVVRRPGRADGKRAAQRSRGQ